jgi:hypothetical protein
MKTRTKVGLLFIFFGVLVMGYVGLKMVFQQMNFEVIHDWSWEGETLEERTEMLPVEGKTKLIVQGRVGKIRLYGDPNAKEVTVKYEKTLMGGVRLGSPEDIRRDVNVSITSTGDSHIIRTDTPDPMFWMKQVAVNYEITLPPHLQIEVTNNAGNVEVLGMESKLDLSLNAGCIEVDGFKESVRAKNNSGCIKIKGGQEIKSVYAHVNAGELRVGLPASANLRVEARTNAGRISSDFAFADSRHEIGREVRGQIGNGSDGYVDLEANTGQILIDRE